VSTAYWVCSTITAISAFVSLGYSIDALARSDQSSRPNSMYTTARSSALAVAAIGAVFVRSDPYLEAIALTMVIVQAVDAVIGALTHDRLKTFDPAATSLANAAALIWLLQP
jgi:hypothetical protein